MNHEIDERPKALRRRNPWRVAMIIAVPVLGGLGLGFFPRWSQSRAAEADMNQLAIPTVAVVSPQPGDPGSGLLLTAEIRPWREAAIYARANGYIKGWSADIGAHVQAGQVLAEIETPDLDQQLEQAKAQLTLAQANLHLAETTDVRWQQLLKTGSIDAQGASEKAAAREAAAASVEAEQANMRRLAELASFQRIVAPFAGTVTSRTVDIGDLIVSGSGGRESFHVAQTEKLRVYVHVPERYALGIAAGQVATLTTSANPGVELPAVVTNTSESISVASRTLLTELEVVNSQHNVLAYGTGEVRLRDNTTAPRLTLPSNTLLFRAQGMQVGVVRPDETIELHSIQVGRDFGQSVEILGGVTASDRVVVNPTDSLVSGIKVRIAAPASPVAAKRSQPL
ncbi:MAG: Efflux transporter, family, subunit [Verrucomicrobia bacterium]|nr:Efflux transporter, family, subunit [Verrucomicrobiota bacterium]